MHQLNGHLKRKEDGRESAYPSHYLQIFCTSFIYDFNDHLRPSTTWYQAYYCLKRWSKGQKGWNSLKLLETGTFSTENKEKPCHASVTRWCRFRHFVSFQGSKRRQISCMSECRFYVVLAISMSFWCRFLISTELNKSGPVWHLNMNMAELF